MAGPTLTTSPPAWEERKALLDQKGQLQKELLTILEGENSRAMDGETAEDRERMSITNRADLGAASRGRGKPSGAHQHQRRGRGPSRLGNRGDQIPLAMLAGYRAADAPADGGGTEGFVGYQFPSSFASFANIARPRVAPGTPVFPSISAASVASRPAEAGAVATSDPTIRGELLTPKRVQAWSSISVEDRARFGGLGAALAVHLAAAVMLGYDAQALGGDDGFFDTSAGPLTAPNNPGAATTAAQYLAMLSGGVDGRYALTPAQVGLLMHPDAYTDGAAIYRTANSEADVMAMIARDGRLMVNAGMPAPAANIVNILRVKGNAQAAVQPMWDGLSIEDVYTDNAKGEIRFSVTGLADFSVQQPAAYDWLKANTS